MTVTKELYAKDKVDNIGSKRPKSKVIPPKDLDIIMDNNGSFIAKNRDYRRRRVVIGLFTRKGFYDYLRRIKITRKNKSGKIKTKYVAVDL